MWEEYREQLAAHPDAIVVESGWLYTGAVRVAEAGDAVVGFSVTLPGEEEGAVELDGLFVEPEHMRHGVGRLLVEDAAARARAAGARRLDVIANPRAVAFYTRVGFRVTGDARTQLDPEPAPRMALDL